MVSSLGRVYSKPRNGTNGGISMQTIVFYATLNNGLKACVWWLPDDYVYYVEVIDPNNIYDDRMDIHIKEAKGVLSYLSELQNYK